MALPFEKIKEEALCLDPDSRVALAHALLVSVDEDLPEADIEQLWLDEAERRQTEVREGWVKLVPGDEVMQRLSKVVD